jgi:hypothetical protein
LQQLRTLLPSFTKPGVPAGCVCESHIAAGAQQEVAAAAARLQRAVTAAAAASGNSSPAPAAAASHPAQHTPAAAAAAVQQLAAMAGPAGTAAAAAVAAADTGAGAAAAAAGVQAAPCYSTLPVGFELEIQLQQLTLTADGKKILDRKAEGLARVRLQQLLGHGGMGDAYLGQLQSYEPAGTQRKGIRRPPKRLVLKLQYPDAKPVAMTPGKVAECASLLMWREYDLLQKLTICDSIVDTYGFGMAAAVDGSTLYGLGQKMPSMMLEYAELGDLCQHLEPSPGRKAPMDALSTNMVVVAVSNALTALHMKGFIHRDVKPQNVLLFKEPGSPLVTYKLSDFGLAEPAPSWCSTDGGGTPAYKPPEGRWVMSSDTFALGKLILACRSAATPEIGTYEQMRASPVYANLPDPMREAEWELLRVCLDPNCITRPCASSLLSNTSHFDYI